MSAAIKGSVFVLASLFFTTQAFGQQCPLGQIDIAGLTARMEATKDPNGILRAAAIGLVGEKQKQRPIRHGAALRMSMIPPRPAAAWFLRGHSPAGVLSPPQRSDV
jgi:hypothetical protein